MYKMYKIIDIFFAILYNLVVICRAMQDGTNDVMRKEII